MRNSFLIAALLCLPLNRADAQDRLLGGDISMLPEYEKAGTLYKDSAGQTVDALTFFKQSGWNAMRVRLFVDPSKAPEEHKGEGVCQDLGYVARLGRRIKAAGMQLMLDFHYSDTWADPAKQFVPFQWKNADAKAIADSVYDYTRRCLKAMAAAGATPDLIQVGNEISNGMIWPMGKVDILGDTGWSDFLPMLEKGAKACREVCPGAKIIIHTERAGEWNKTRAFYSQLKRAATDYDVIGLSYYPMWHERIPVLRATLDSLATLFPDKEVMIVETAAYYSHENDPWATADQYAEFFPITKAGQADFTRQLVTELRLHDNVKGLFWWYPEENAFGNSVSKGWLNRGLFDNHTGKALPAFYEFAKYLDKNDEKTTAAE